MLQSNEFICIVDVDNIIGKEEGDSDKDAAHFFSLQVISASKPIVTRCSSLKRGSKDLRCDRFLSLNLLANTWTYLHVIIPTKHACVYFQRVHSFYHSCNFYCVLDIYYLDQRSFPGSFGAHVSLMTDWLIKAGWLIVTQSVIPMTYNNCL